MPMVERASFTFTGKLRADEFTAFARHRAARLDLSIDIASASDKAVVLSVCGSHDLVDAFEMACSLGPYACLVLNVARHSDLAT